MKAKGIRDAARQSVLLEDHLCARIVENSHVGPGFESSWSSEGDRPVIMQVTRVPSSEFQDKSEWYHCGEVPEFQF